jgi:hypothetical protein
MKELATKSREAMKAKARRLAGASSGKVDSSTWSPAPPLNADIKTGARPIMRPSSKGIGESNKAADTKAAIGRDMKRGAFNRGGGVLDKKAVGDVQVLPKRGAAEHYKKGGKVKRADGGRDPSYVGAASVTERGKPVTRPKDIQDTRSREPDASDLYSSDQMKRLERGYKKGGSAKNWIAGAIEKPGALRKSLGVKEGEKIPAKKLAKAAEAPGKMGKRARLAQTLKKLGKKRGGGVGLTVVIADKGAQQQPMQQGMAAAPRAVPVPPPAAMPPQMPPPPMRKAGGRLTKVASSYKDMEAGAASGEGRLQKSDIAKKRKGAPTA